MPRYEFLYLLAGHITDEEQPKISAQIREIVEGFGGSEIQEEYLGKKKLAYQIGKTKNGHYVVLHFNLSPAKLSQLDAKIRTMKTTIIRYLILNIDEDLKKIAKDKAIHAAMPARRQQDDGVPLPVTTPEVESVKEVVTEVEDTATPTEEIAKPVLDLDAQIEAALNEDKA